MLRAGSPLLLVLAASGAAHAGRTFYGWLPGTEVMLDRGAELLTWVDEVNKGSDGGNARATTWNVSAQLGATRQLEIGLPAVFRWSRSDTQPPRFDFDRFGIEARYLLLAPPDDGPVFAPLVRVAVLRPVADRDAVRPEANVAASLETGRFHLIADLGFVGVLGAGVRQLELRPSAGISVLAVGALRLGAEGYAELKLDAGRKSWAVAGPNVAWTHGRFWLSASYGVGVFGIANAPRVAWGVAF